MVNLLHPTTLLAFVLLCSTSEAQVPLLGDSRTKTMETLRLACLNLNSYILKSQGRDSAATFIETGDTLVYRASADDEARYTFTFQNDRCVGIDMRLSCLVCLRRSYRKDLFKGSWRVDENGYLYRSTNPARASIRRVVNCPFLYEVNVRSMEVPLPKDSFRKMKKVKRKWLGTLDSVLREV